MSQRSAAEGAEGSRGVLRSGLRPKDSSADWKVSHSGFSVRKSKTFCAGSCRPAPDRPRRVNPSSEAPKLLRLAFGGRGWARWAGRVAAVKCFPSPDSSRHGIWGRQRLGALGLARCRREMLPSARQLPARDVLENLPIFRSQTRASFRSRAARAYALLASLSLLCVS